jgi:hypothetical protein
MKRPMTILWVILFAFAMSVRGLADEAKWQAGVARVKITPERPMWMSGYAVRNRPAEGTLDDLWAKALVLKDAAGHTAVLVTMDLVGIDRELSRDVCRRVEQQFHIPRPAMALTVSHTHSGPVLRHNLEAMYTLDERQMALVERYTTSLGDKLVDVVGSAITDLRPAELAWGIGTATFAVNRRNNSEADVLSRRASGTLVGPVDHDVPVLAVRDETGKLLAIVCGYACHATVLDGYQWSGDWPGAAQMELERRHPDVLALFWAGCGADQNPLPRRSVDLMRQYGNEFADAVDETLSAPFKPIVPLLNVVYEEIDLPFGDLPTRQELESQAAGTDHVARWARFLLRQWDNQKSLPASYPYPVQVWRLGDELNWIFLGGEVVVDYSLRLKAECGAKNTWVTSYANDVMGYIPSRRVLLEGGYEGGGSRYFYGLPALWHDRVEERIVSKAVQTARTETASETEHD